MIRAVFHKGREGFRHAEVSGHAGYADAGSDIVCAAVTSAVQMAANGITEVIGQPAEISIGENRIIIALGPECSSRAEQMLAALQLHLSVLSQQYTEHIQLTVTEVQ